MEAKYEVICESIMAPKLIKSHLKQVPHIPNHKCIMNPNRSLKATNLK